MNSDDEMLKKLDSDTYDSIVYIGYYDPKTQAELARYVYGKKANLGPLIEARRRLVNKKWLGYINDFDGLKNIPLKSSLDPFIEHLRRLSKERISTKGDKFRLTEDDLDYIMKLMDSDYFRKTFFSYEFFDICFGIHRGKISRDSKGKLTVKSAFYLMKNALNAIVIQSICLYDEGFKVRDFYIQSQDLIKKYNIFDDFLIFHFNDFHRKNLKNLIINNSRMDTIVPRLEIDLQMKYYFEHVVLNGLFLVVPIELALKIIAVSTPSPLLSFVVEYNSLNIGVNWITPEFSRI